MTIVDAAAMALYTLDQVLAGQQSDPPLTDPVIHEQLTTALQGWLGDLRAGLDDELDVPLPDEDKAFKELKGALLGLVDQYIETT